MRNPKIFADRITRKEANESSFGIPFGSFNMMEEMSFIEPLFQPLFTPFFKQAGDEMETEEAIVNSADQEKQEETKPQQVSKPPDEEERIPYPIKIPEGTVSKEGFHNYVERYIFKKVVGIAWSGGTEVDAIYSDITNNVGKTIVFNVSVSTLKRYGVNRSKDPKSNKQKENNGLANLSEGERAEINAEVNKRYYEQTKIAEGTPIGLTNPIGAEIWRDIRKELLAEKEQIDNLSAATKDFIQLTGKVKPADYAKILQIIKLLKKFSASDMLDYQGMINLETTDPDLVIQSLQAYLANKQEEQQEAEVKEKVETKLYGLEALYKKYVAFKEKEGSYKMVPLSRDGFSDELRDNARNKEESERKELTQLMQENGFSSIDQFSRYVLAYQKSFEQHTIRIAEHHLMKYRSFLSKEKKKVEENKIEANGKSYLANLLEKIKGSGAQANFAVADDKFRSSTNALGSRSKGNDFATADNALASAALHKEASTELNIAKDKIKGLSGITELISEDQFDLEGFANVSSEGELGSFLNGYIIKKEESIEKTWKDIHENPEGIYELNELMSASKTAQQIEKGSIFDLIINDKIEELGGDKLLEAICAVVIGIALIVLNIVSLGASTGLTVAVATATLGFSAYFVDEAIAEYQEQDAANDVGFLTNDPSYVWVLIAILGAVADVAAFTKVLRSASKIKEAVDVLDTGGVATFEKKILEISDLEEKVKDNLIKQARLKERITEVGKELLSTMNSGFNPKLFEYAFLSIKNGVTTFDGFIKELKLAKLIKETGLSSEELRGLKDLFNQAKLLSKDGRLMAELEKAIAKKDVGKLKELLQTKTSVISTTRTELKEISQAMVIGDYLGGGEFRIEDYKRGVEGFLVKGEAQIPISLKTFTTPSLKNIFREIRSNAIKIKAESIVDKRIITGSKPNTVLFAEIVEFDQADILKHISESNSDILPSGSIFEKVIFKSKDSQLFTVKLQ